MPRISAPTVAEHRAAQRRALLDAGREIIADTGRPPTLSGVATRTGLARPSVYEYFSSADELLTALVEDMTPRWSARVRAEMATAPSAAERVLAYVHANLALVAEGEHAIAAALAAIAPEQVSDERSRAMHQHLLEPLTSALSDLGVEHPVEVTAMVDAMVRSAARLIEEGTPLAEAWAAASAVLAPFVHAGRPDPAPTAD